MTMIVYLKAPTGVGGEVRSGWLVLKKDEPNVFHTEISGATHDGILLLYGALPRTVIHISSSEYRRFKRECGVK